MAITGLTPTRVISACAAPARRDRRARGREERDAGLDRRVAEHLLHVQAEQEEAAEDRAADAEAHRVGHGDRTDLEQLEGNEGVGRASLTKKIVIRITARIVSPIVWSEAQPASGARDIA